MNLETPLQNIYNDNNDDDEEEQISDDDDDEDYEEVDEEEDDDEEEVVDNDEEVDGENEEEEDDDNHEDEEKDDEPDFMDNSGKCWEFGSKIEDEKHLKEWCQNKMGGMIVGKEEKLTRQFHCKIKQCQFKAIFLKSFSTIYTRNKHNHAMKNGKNNQRKKEEKTIPPSQSKAERDYVDHLGKLWPFRANLGKNVSHHKLFTKFGFTKILPKTTTLNLYCRKSNPAGGQCPFAGIYLKSNGCLYTRGEHQHTKRGKTPQNVGDDYVDLYSKIWKFNKEIGKNVKPEIFLNKFGFNHTRKTGIGFNLKCQKKYGYNGKCKFAGIYLNSNGCLYIRGKHNHPHIEKTNLPEQNFVDKYGKLWPFRANIGKNISQDIFRINFGFNGLTKTPKTLQLYCQKRTTNGEKCPYKGIYMKSNGYLYTQGEHDHTKRKITPKNVGEDYIDHFGKIWKFNKEIGKNVKREMLYNEFGFTSIRAKISGLDLRCETQRNNRRCKYVGVYLKSNGCLYTRGKHNHEHIEKNPIPNVGDNYVDKLGKIWPFHAEIGKQHIPDEIWHSKFGFSTIQQKLSTLNLYCRKEGINGGRCPFTGIYIKENGCLYIRGKHEHKYSG